jgi:hypothetical protein
MTAPRESADPATTGSVLSPALANPYAPPAFDAEPTRTRKTRTDRVAVAFVSLYAIASLTAVASDAMVLGGVVETNNSSVPRVVAAVLLFAWLWRRWASLPAEAQHAVAGKRIGPWLAVFFHFLPGFNFFWIFKAQIALRDGVNGALRKKGSAWIIPRQPAVLAPLVYLCSVFWLSMLRTSWFYLVPAALSPAVWTLHMGLVERAWRHRRKAID